MFIVQFAHVSMPSLQTGRARRFVSWGRQLRSVPVTPGGSCQHAVGNGTRIKVWAASWGVAGPKTTAGRRRNGGLKPVRVLRCRRLQRVEAAQNEKETVFPGAASAVRARLSTV